MRALYSVELLEGGRWHFIEARSSMKLAREFRERIFSGTCVTRIRKWVRP